MDSLQRFLLLVETLDLLDIVYALFVAVSPYTLRAVFPLDGRPVAALASVSLPRRPVQIFPSVDHVRTVSVVIAQI